jgi:uncharacterized repeat protein (TIGR03803 family)
LEEHCFAIEVVVHRSECKNKGDSSVKKFGLGFLLITLSVLAGRLESASGATLKTLYSFLNGADGGQPLAALVQGSDSNFYGTTYSGGLVNTGTVFKINTAGSLTTLHSFTGGLDGGKPQAALVQGIDGNFYGTTSAGGLLSSNAGTVFAINSLGTLTTLYRFSGGADGGQPRGALVQGTDTNFYGTAYAGGTNGLGVVFKMTPAGTLTTLWQFNGITDGSKPLAGLVQGPNNNFFGTTFAGGASGLGTVFAITPSGALTTLYSFTGGFDGANPAGGLVLGNNSRFYGTATGGGNGTGAVFQIGMSGGLTPIYNFMGGGDGGFPEAGLILGSDGNFYGTTAAEGAGGGGTVFKITPGGALTVLHSFRGLDGATSVASLVQGTVSNFYGTTLAGGTNNEGTVYTLIQPCTYSLLPTHVTLPATDDTGSFTITAGITNCPWTAISSVDWITVTSSNSGFGDGTVSYSVAANTNTTARVGTISVEGRTLTITQQAEVLGRFLLGTYAGLVNQSGSPSNASSGFISLAVGKTGSFTARLTVGGVRSSFKGTFDSSGNSTNTVTRRSLSSLQIVLQLLDVTNETDEVVGTVSDGVFTSDLVANLAVFSRVTPCPFAGNYTFVLEPADDTDPTVPQGFGFGTLAVSTTGTGQMRGILGDGTKMSASAPVAIDGTWPLYVPLYKNQGSCIASVTIDTNHLLEATANWFKPVSTLDHDYPGGFATSPNLSGARYISPKDGGPSIAGSGTLTLGGGNLESNLVKSVVIAASGSVTASPTGSDKLTLKVNPTTGQFSGSFLNPADGKTTKLSGSLLQNDNSAAGFFPGTNQTGFVTIEPGP